MGACSERRDFLTERTHPSMWSNPTSPNFHGKAVLESPSGLETCASCHGVDYSGGVAGVSCASCHEVYPHVVGFSNPGSPNFHEQYFINKGDWNLAQCQGCHGTNYQGNGVDAKNCTRQ